MRNTTAPPKRSDTIFSLLFIVGILLCIGVISPNRRTSVEATDSNAESTVAVSYSDKSITDDGSVLGESDTADSEDNEEIDVADEDEEAPVTEEEESSATEDVTEFVPAIEDSALEVPAAEQPDEQSVAETINPVEYDPITTVTEKVDPASGNTVRTTIVDNGISISTTVEELTPSRVSEQPESFTITVE